jgi:hypothetical protein
MANKKTVSLSLTKLSTSEKKDIKKNADTLAECLKSLLPVYLKLESDQRQKVKDLNPTFASILKAIDEVI